MDIWGNLGLGVVSGVVSAGLLWLFRVLIAGHFLPWYFQRVYRGLNIDGKWNASEFGFTQDITLDIKQVASKISGSARFALRQEQGAKHYEDVREFQVDGAIQDRYITLTLSHKNRQRIGVVTFVLEPFADGRQLRGQMSYVSVASHCIRADEVHFARDPKVVRAMREEREEELAEMLASGQDSGPKAPRRKKRRRAASPPPKGIVAFNVLPDPETRNSGSLSAGGHEEPPGDDQDDDEGPQRIVP